MRVYPIKERAVALTIQDYKVKRLSFSKNDIIYPNLSVEVTRQ
jgi:hypothetical protein